MGMIFDIQRFSVHDGPGIRTTVFFKGCNLRCVWCHNPESFVPEKQLSYNKFACTQCGECMQACLENVHGIEESSGGRTHTVDFDKCTACGKCASVCIQQALKIIGYEASAEEIIQIVLKDKKYYEASGGGLTISGGEPTFQFDFLLDLLESAKKSGIHTCLETNGCLSADKLKALLPLVDLFLVDFKNHNPKEHAKHTGADLQNIYDTLNLLKSNNAPVLLRCPIIPGINDHKQHYNAIKELEQNYKNITGVEMLPFHALGRDKWEQIGLRYSFGKGLLIAPFWIFLLPMCCH